MHFTVNHPRGAKDPRRLAREARFTGRRTENPTIILLPDAAQGHRRRGGDGKIDPNGGKFLDDHQGHEAELYSIRRRA
jgi:hypothetical protein